MKRAKLLNIFKLYLQWSSFYTLVVYEITSAAGEVFDYHDSKLFSPDSNGTTEKQDPAINTMINTIRLLATRIGRMEQLKECPICGDVVTGEILGYKDVLGVCRTISRISLMSFRVGSGIFCHVCRELPNLYSRLYICRIPLWCADMRVLQRIF